MPINTDLNISPYFDDFDVDKQFYRVLFKPAYAVQARELIQLQSMLQNQIEQFGDNIFKEGSIVKGCAFTNLDRLEFVKLADIDSDGNQFDPRSYIPKTELENFNGTDEEVDYVYTITSPDQPGMKAEIISASRGFTSRPPDLNTFFIQYLSTADSGIKQFEASDTLNIARTKIKGGNIITGEDEVFQISIAVANQTPVGKSFGIQSSPGIVFQKGHFLFTTSQTLIVSKYTNVPDDLSVGYTVSEELISFLKDESLYDNANGSKNENAPGADRLKLIPVLTVKETPDAEEDSDFFTLIRYQNGSAVEIRDVSQYNVLGDEMARRTFEESGNYVVEKFNVKSDRRGTSLSALVGPGLAYVKGYRIQNTGERDFAIDEIANTDIQNSGAVSLNYGGYADIDTIQGTVNIDYSTADLQNGSGTKIGECVIRNITPTGIYIGMVRMIGSNYLANVQRIASNTGYINVGSGGISSLKQLDKNPFVFPTGTLSLKATTDNLIPIRRSRTATPSGSTITLTDSDPIFNVENDDIVVVDGTNTVRTVSSVSTSNNFSELNITLSTTPSGTCTVYHNALLGVDSVDGTSAYSKVLREPYIKVNHSNSQDTYQLGFPDVFEILSIRDASGVDYTNSFRLRPNQKDTHYDISYMEYINGRPRPANSAVLTIQLKVFQINNATGHYYFTVDSYPIDDTTPEDDPAFDGKIRTHEIPVYRGSNRKNYNLRECFDFRPYCDKDSSADYTINNGASAPTISGAGDDNVPLFSGTSGGSSFIIPALNTAATADLEYYLARIDMITLDSFGRFKVIKGTEQERPIPPTVPQDEVMISQISVPGYPALTPKEARQKKKPEYSIKVKSHGTKNYTMKDISRIDRKVKALEDFVTLNTLEQKTQNLLITDENGLTRFKNGYIVDPFKNLRLGNLEDPNFSAAVMQDREILSPSLKTFPLDLKLKSNSGTTMFPSSSYPELATLSIDSDIAIISQKYATGFRNCVSNFYKYMGQGSITPSHDSVHDTVGDPVSIETDIATPFSEFAENIQEFLPLTETTTVPADPIQIGPADEWFPTERETDTTRTLTIGERVERRDVGEFVSNVSFSPFMRERYVRIHMSGLRPNTRHYFFFDGVDVNQHVMPAYNRLFHSRFALPLGPLGGSISTNQNGVLNAVFNIPSETFFVGSKKLEIVDVDQYSTIESASTSYGSLMYHAYNINIERTALTQTTRIPEFSISETSTTRNLARRARPQPDPEPTGGGGGGGGGGFLAAVAAIFFFDPIAQTFYIKEGIGGGSNTVYASKVDLYFKRKSTSGNGITVMLREVINGYPSAEVIPFSKVHLNASQVNISDNGSAVTTINFEAPVRLDTEKEYAIVVMPDANDPNYLIFTSKVGGNDLRTNAAVVQDWGDGVLFTSTNNKAWHSYQDEDIKFTLYRHEFGTSAGSITLSPDDNEFLTLSDWTGEFKKGEPVYQAQSLSGATQATVSIGIGDFALSGQALDETYSAGDKIILTDASVTYKDIFEVESVDSSTQMTLTKPSWFAVNNGTSYPVVTAEVAYANPKIPSDIHLSHSDATSTNRFTSGQTIVGKDSGATGDILTVDNINVSFVQPMITRSNDIVTTTTMTGLFVDPENTINTFTKPLKFGDTNYFNTKGNVLYSKSNDPTETKPFNFIINLENGANATSTPFVDLEHASLIAYQYKVTNVAASTSKFISKTIELKESLDAEDMNAILTAYRPRGTDIKVYIRAQNAYDSSQFDTLPWIELELFEGVTQYSSAANLEDYREFRYRVPDSAKDGNGVLEYTSASGTFAGYRRFAIRIDLIAENNYQVPTVKDYRGIALT